MKNSNAKVRFISTLVTCTTFSPLFFLCKATRYTHAHMKDTIVDCIFLTKYVTLHCYKQQDNEDMRNISSETSV
jgi:hypothetical protein